MESKNAIKSIVKSPARDSQLRTGQGFSLSEIEASGHSISTIKKLNIKIDYFRKSSHEHNIESLKSLNIPDSKEKKREPFVQKEKKRTPYKPKTNKRRKKPAPVKKITETKPKVKVEEKPKKETKKPVKIKPVETDKTPLVKLAGLGPTTAGKFSDMGVNCVEDLLKEKPEELAPLIKGCSEEKITKWIEEGKELISQ